MLLIGRGHTVSADRLVEALWPDGAAPDGAARSVVTYVSRLRGALGDGHIATTGAGYRLVCERASCDVDEFEALVEAAESALPDRAIDCYDRALALWGGRDPFGEFTGEWWALAESTRLAELRLVAREERAAALMAIGHHGRAVPDLEGLIVEHPLRERPVSLLMQALVATGRQAEALRVFRSYRSRLAEETGLDPSAEWCSWSGRSPAASNRPADRVGRPLRGYTIHEAIGEGRYGRVYAATQPGTERRVAIKVIRPDLADSAAFIRRFEAEARLVARLEHPHIVPLYDYWREPGGAYLVFRLLTGGTARDSVISGGAWSVARVSQLVEEVGGALIAAHAAGVAAQRRQGEQRAARRPRRRLPHGLRHRRRRRRLVGRPRSASRRSCVTWDGCCGSCSSASRPVPDATTSSIAGRPGPAPPLLGRAAVPEGLDAVLAKATAAAGGYATMAELVLGWRAAVGRPEGVLSPVTSDERRAVDAARRRGPPARAVDRGRGQPVQGAATVRRGRRRGVLRARGRVRRPGDGRRPPPSRHRRRRIRVGQELAGASRTRAPAARRWPHRRHHGPGRRPGGRTPCRGVRGGQPAGPNERSDGAGPPRRRRRAARRGDRSARGVLDGEPPG